MENRFEQKARSLAYRDQLWFWLSLVSFEMAVRVILPVMASVFQVLQTKYLVPFAVRWYRIVFCILETSSVLHIFHCVLDKS